MNIIRIPSVKIVLISHLILKQINVYMVYFSVYTFYRIYQCQVSTLIDHLICVKARVLRYKALQFANTIVKYHSEYTSSKYQQQPYYIQWRPARLAQ